MSKLNHPPSPYPDRTHSMQEAELPPSGDHIPKAFLILLLFVFFANFTMVAPYLLAVFLGWLLALILDPVDVRLRKFFKLKHRGFAPLISTLIATFTIILPIAGFGFLTVKQLTKILGPIAERGFEVETVVARIQNISLVNKLVDDPEELRTMLNELSKDIVGKLSGILSSVLSAAPELVLQLTLALLTCYFILRDGKKLRDWVSPRIPLTQEVRVHLGKSLTDIAYSSFISMLVASVVQAIIVLIGFLVLKVPMAALAFGLAFIFAWFPIFGVTPVWAAATIYLFAVDRTGAAVGMIGVGLLASLSDNISRPWVIKDRSDIHPLISLVAIFGAIHFFGILGVLVGPVLAGFLIELLEIWPPFAVSLGLKNAKPVPDMDEPRTESRGDELKKDHAPVPQKA